MGRRQSGVDNLDAVKNDGEVSAKEMNTEPETVETQKSDVQDVESKDVTDGNNKVLGFVSGCDSLNLRDEPKIDSNVVSVLRSDSEVIIYESESTDDFYKVCSSAGVDGYCMRQYITVK